MLPLHITFRNITSASFSLVIILISCSDRSKTDLATITALEESIDNSNKLLLATSNDIMISLENKLSDPGTHEIASSWYPKAKRIQYLSKQAFDNIEEIKKKLGKEVRGVFGNDSLDLYEMLINYRKEVLQVDPGITKEFKESMRLFTQSVDSSNNNQKKLLKKYFDGASMFAVKAILTKFQNNIRINEERITAFCNENMAIDFVIRDYNATWPFVIQSSTIVQADDQIEITAGVGSFNLRSNPKVFIYGKQVSTEYDGAAHYKLKTGTKPGKYYVPVKINYTDQDGKTVTVEKEMEYTVANIQKQ